MCLCALQVQPSSRWWRQQVCLLALAQLWPWPRKRAPTGSTRYCTVIFFHRFLWFHTFWVWPSWLTSWLCFPAGSPGELCCSGERSLSCAASPRLGVFAFLLWGGPAQLQPVESPGSSQCTLRTHTNVFTFAHTQPKEALLDFNLIFKATLMKC